MNYFVCARCGKKGNAEEMVIVSESSVRRGIIRDDETAKPHTCGFIGIRCKCHPDAEKKAVRAVRDHLRNLVENHGYVYEP